MKDGKYVKIDLMKEVVEKVKETLKDFFKGSFDGVGVKNITPVVFQQCLESCDVDINEDTDYNGWECDYWYTCTHEGQVYTVNGGGWYGNATIERGVV